MDEKTFVSGLPLTDDEREQDAARKRDMLARQGARKKACPSGHRYNVPATAAHREQYDKIGGK